MNASQNLCIRPLAAEDHDGLATLMAQMQAHYRVPCPERATMLAGLGALPPGVEILVAQRSGVVVGFAALCALYPGPGLTSGFFLKELFVAEQARGAGIGRALMHAAAELAVARGHRRLDWTADRDDPALLRFYESLGAVAQPQKIFFRLSGEALAETARPPTARDDA